MAFIGTPLNFSEEVRLNVESRERIVMLKAVNRFGDRGMVAMNIQEATNLADALVKAIQLSLTQTGR